MKTKEKMVTFRCRSLNMLTLRTRWVYSKEKERVVYFLVGSTLQVGCIINCRDGTTHVLRILATYRSL